MGAGGWCIIADWREEFFAGLPLHICISTVLFKQIELFATEECLRNPKGNGNMLYKHFPEIIIFIDTTGMRGKNFSKSFSPS